jgi:hypothetical protein
MKRFMAPRLAPRLGLPGARHLTMRPLAWQAGLFVVISTCVAAAAAAAAAAERGPAAQQLAQECDALIATAVKRPYGWAWTAQANDGAGDRKPQVDMRPGATPAAGAVLLWAGALLGEPRYIEAAVNDARGVVAAQASNGNVVTEPTFGPSVGKREPPAAVPDRAATRAGAALLLACVGADESKDELLKRAAVRATAWLAKQQANDGGFPTEPPVDAPRSVATRLIRLDDRDVRDSTFALLLSATSADDKLAARAAQRSTEKLVGMRTSAPGRFNHLWSTWYRQNGDLEDGLHESPPGADMIASRRAIETLLAAALLANDEHAKLAARDAAQSLRALRDTQGRWTRLYVSSGEQPRPSDESIFGPASTQPSDALWRGGTFGLDGVLEAVDQLVQLGPAEMSARLSESVTIQERLAATVLGVTDHPFDLRVSEDAAERKTELALRVQRVFDLLRDARREVNGINVRKP